MYSLKELKVLVSLLERLAAISKELIILIIVLYFISEKLVPIVLSLRSLNV